MLREIVRPTSEFYNIHIPKEYINTEVEILVLPFSHDYEHKDRTNNELFSKTSGILKDKNINPEKWQEDMRGEWDR